MKKHTEFTEFLEEEIEKKKKKYIPPIVEVVFVEMECGVAANSAAVSPATVGGNTAQVNTDWNGNDDTTLNNVPFDFNN